MDSNDDSTNDQGRQDQEECQIMKNLPAPPSPKGRRHGGGDGDGTTTKKTGPPLPSTSSSSQRHRNMKYDTDDDYKTSIETKYANYPLVRGMILHEKARYVCFPYTTHIQCINCWSCCFISPNTKKLLLLLIIVLSLKYLCIMFNLSSSIIYMQK